MTVYGFGTHSSTTRQCKATTTMHAGLEYKDLRKPRNKNFVDVRSLFIIQALYSLTSMEHIRSKSLRI